MSRVFAEKFLKLWNESTGQEYGDVDALQKVIRRLRRNYSDEQIIRAAKLAGQHHYWSTKAPYQLGHPRNRLGPQDPVGDILSAEIKNKKINQSHNRRGV